MPTTYSQVSIHCILAVKGKEYQIGDDFREDLHEYMKAALRNEGALPLAIGSRADHLHVFFELPMVFSISDLVRLLKTTSAQWINDHHFQPGRFHWQDGYSAFSYSHSQREALVHYIISHQNHHESGTFKEEYLDILRKYGILFDERAIFEFYD